MSSMLNLTIPVEGIFALRTALGEDRAIAVAQALEHARIQGEADLAKRILDEAQAEARAYFVSREEFERAVAKLATREQIDQIMAHIAQLPNREELKRFATHEDLGELRSQFLRLDKKMTIGFLTLLALNLTSNAPLFIEWGTKVVGYALK